MKKILVVAHPDDEVLWFEPMMMDKILITFLERAEQRITEGRKRVLELHPFKNKIKCFGLKESNFWKDKTKIKEYKDNFDDLLRKLKSEINEPIEFWTHNAWGEYEHTDHILVHQVVIELAQRFNLPVYCFNGIMPIDIANPIWIDIDLGFYNGLKSLYIKEGAWTYYKNYQPQSRQQYFKAL